MAESTERCLPSPTQDGKPATDANEGIDEEARRGAIGASTTPPSYRSSVGLSPRRAPTLNYNLSAGAGFEDR